MAVYVYPLPLLPQGQKDKKGYARSSLGTYQRAGSWDGNKAGRGGGTAGMARVFPLPLPQIDATLYSSLADTAVG